MTLIIMALWVGGIALLIGVAVHRGRLPAKQKVAMFAEPPKEYAPDSPKTTEFRVQSFKGLVWKRIRAKGEISRVNIVPGPLGSTPKNEKPSPVHISDKVKKPIRS